MVVITNLIRGSFLIKEEAPRNAEVGASLFQHEPPDNVQREQGFVPAHKHTWSDYKWDTPM